MPVSGRSSVDPAARWCRHLAYLEAEADKVPVVSRSLREAINHAKSQIAAVEGVPRSNAS